MMSENQAVPFATSRVFVAVATDSVSLPGTPDYNGQWVIHNEGKAALMTVEHLLNVPSNAILAASLEEGMALLDMVKEKLMPNMTDSSGLQICVVHTEAIMDPSSNSLQGHVLLFPVGFMALGDIKARSAASVTTDIPDHIDESPSESQSARTVLSVVDGGKASTCEVCGKTFRPDNPNQPACNQCLNVPSK